MKRTTRVSPPRWTTAFVCHMICQMRTTLDLDDELMEALLARYPQDSKTQAVERAIRDHVERSAVEGLLALRGKIAIEDLSVELRRDRTWPA